MVKKVTCSCGQRFGNDEQHRIHALKHGPSTHQRVRGPVTFADAVAAGDGTLHGAIDHWQDRAKTAEARLAEAERALREICAVDKAAPGRRDCHIWADMLAIASAAVYGRDSFMSIDEPTDSAEPRETDAHG